jgi:acyl-CoA hydrolase
LNASVFAERARDLLARTRHLTVGGAQGEPSALLDALWPIVEGLPDLELLIGMSNSAALAQAPPSVALRSFVGMGSNAELVRDGRMKLLPCHMSTLPSLFDSYRGAHTAAVLVSPPNDDGWCSLGLGTDYIADAVRTADHVIAEVNPNVPFLGGDALVPFERLDAVVVTDRPIPEHSRVPPGDLERRIADNVAALISDGACIQVGIGRLADAVLEALRGRNGLGAHTGLIGDALLDLMDAGVITNEHKGFDTGVTTAGAVLGTPACLRALDRHPRVVLRGVTTLQAPHVIAELPNFVAVNSAVQVDLLGQVNAELLDGRPVGGIASQVDFMRAAALSEGGRSVIALPAAARQGTRSRIVEQVERVTTARSDVDVIVTEHGTAHLRGVADDERARRVIGVAAPDHRPALVDAARRLGLW